MVTEELLPATLQNVLDQQTLKWIFCGRYNQCFGGLLTDRELGGKGGVGQRATSHGPSGC
jgi:hypothetical protein